MLGTPQASVDSARSLENLELATQTPLPPSRSTLNVAEALPHESNNGTLHQANTSSRNESSLAPVDKGFDAWSFLAAAFWVETLVWGFPGAFGVFLDVYLRDPVYAQQKNAPTLLPLVGTLSSGILYCSGLIVDPTLARWPHWRRACIWMGAVLCWASLFGASYARTVEELVLTQGVLYAIGGSLIYAPCLSYISEWFVQRRGLARGIFSAGTSLGGLVLPLVLPPLIARLGHRSTLRVLSYILGGTLLPILPFLKGRLPLGGVQAGGRRTRAWMRDRTFVWLTLVTTVQGFGYFVPIVWLPTFANDLLVGEASSALAVALLNGASFIGRLVMGVLSDKYNPWLLSLTTLLSASAATFVLWGVLSHTLAGLLAFGVAYGLVAGGSSSLWTGFVNGIANDPIQATAMFQALLFSRGIGNILSTPISASLVRTSNSNSSFNTGPLAGAGRLGFDVAGGRFERVIVYVGTCFAGAAVVAGAGWGAEGVRGRRGGGG